MIKHLIAILALLAGIAVGQTTPVVFELACPSPYQPLTFAVSMDQQTGKLRAYGCINEATGDVLWQADTVNTQTLECSGAPCQTPLRVNNIGDTMTATDTGMAGIYGILTVADDLNADGPSVSLVSSTLGSGVYNYEYDVRELPYDSSTITGSFDTDLLHSAKQSLILSSKAATFGTGNVVMKITCFSPFDAIEINRAQAGTNSLGVISTGTTPTFLSCKNGPITFTDNSGVTVHGGATTWYSSTTLGLVKAAGLVPINDAAANAESVFTSDDESGNAGFGQLLHNSQFTWSPELSCKGSGTTGSCQVEGALQILKTTVSGLPSAATFAGAIAIVTDGTGVSSCTGGGSTVQIAVASGGVWTCH